MTQSYPESLTRYIQKSFEKCISPDERIFMEQELIRITERCKERSILFSRDWDAVTQPQLVRETPTAYQRINESIREGDQGVIQRVQTIVQTQFGNQN